jgi:hypothetical protein
LNGVTRYPYGSYAYRYLTEWFKALPYARSADDYEALLPWKLVQRTDATAAQFASPRKGVVNRPLTIRIARDQF